VQDKDIFDGLGDTNISIDDILSEFGNGKKENSADNAEKDIKKSDDKKINSNIENLKEDIKSEKKEFKLQKDTLEKRVNEYVKPVEEPITSKEAINRNKMKNFIQEFYGDNSEEDKATESKDIAIKEDSALTNEEPEKVIVAEKEQELPRKFYNREDYGMPIWTAVPETNTKIRPEHPIEEDNKDKFENNLNTEEVKAEKKGLAGFINKLLAEAEDDEEPIEQEEAPVVEIDEFESIEDKETVVKDLLFQKRDASFKTLVGGIFTFLLLYLNIGVAYPFLLPGFLRPEVNIFAFCTACILLMLFLIITALGSFVSGIKNLITFKPSNESLPSISMVISIAFCVYSGLAGVSQENAFVFYGAAPSIAFFLCLFGKYLRISAVCNNSSILINENEKIALTRITKNDMPYEINTDDNKISAVCKSDFFTGFLERSFEKDPSEKFSKKTGMFLFLICLVIFAVSFIRSGAYVAFTSLCASTAICAPFISGLCFSLPYFLKLKKLAKKEAFITNYTVAQEFSDTNALVISDHELFSEKNLEITGMKMSADSEIFDVAVAVASLYNAVNCPLRYAFLKLMDNKNEFLKDVEDIEVFDKMGVSGKLGNDEIAAGNASFMEYLNVDLPETDYVKKFGSDNKHIIFYSKNGILKGLFVVRYSAQVSVINQLSDFDFEENALIVNSDDQNITENLIRKVFCLKNMDIVVFSSKKSVRMNTVVEKKEKTPATVVSQNGICGILYAITAAGKIKRSVTICIILRALCIAIALAMTAFLVFSQTPVETQQMLAYQGIWGLLCLIISLLL